MSYLTLSAQTETELVEKKSRFISACAQVETERQALDFIERRRKLHPTASHTVYAYSIREGNLTRYSDDGEPQGTSGKPTMNVLMSKNITDAVIATTRYFGGTLLGRGGLVKAYSDSAVRAVELAGVCEMVFCENILITTEYRFFEPLKRMVLRFGGVIAESIFDERANALCRLREDKVDEFLSAVGEMCFDTHRFERLGGGFEPVLPE